MPSWVEFCHQMGKKKILLRRKMAVKTVQDAPRVEAETS